MAKLAWELANSLMLPPNLAAAQSTGLQQGLYAVQVVTGHSADGNEIVKWETPSKQRLAEDVYFRATRTLRLIPYQDTRAALTSVLNRASNGFGSIWALTSMIQAGDLSQAIAHKDVLFNPPSQAPGTTLQLREAIEGIPSVTGNVQFLKGLFSSSAPDVREGASERLAVANTIEATAALEADINDSDMRVRVETIEHICTNTGECNASDAAKLADPTRTDDVRMALHAWLQTRPQ